MNENMQWKIFDENCPKDVEMLFLYHGNEVWFSGKYEDDTEYGLGISDADGHFVSPKFISRYLEIKLPNHE